MEHQVKRRCQIKSQNRIEDVVQTIWNQTRRPCLLVTLQLLEGLAKTLFSFSSMLLLSAPKLYNRLSDLQPSS